MSNVLIALINWDYPLAGTNLFNYGTRLSTVSQTGRLALKIASQFLLGKNGNKPRKGTMHLLWCWIALMRDSTGTETSDVFHGTELAKYYNASVWICKCIYLMNCCVWTQQDFTRSWDRTFVFLQCLVAGDMNDSVVKGVRLWINRFLYVTFITKDLLGMGLKFFIHKS